MSNWWIAYTVALFGAAFLGLALISFRAYRRANPPIDRPEKGPLSCPFCNKLVHESVSYLGQNVTCPQCGGAFQAFHYKGPTHDPEFQKAMVGIFEGVGVIVIVAVVWWLAWGSWG